MDMKKDDLVIELRKELNKIALKKDGPRGVADYCNEHRGIPISDIMDLVTDRVSLFNQEIEILYCLCEAVDNLYYKNFVYSYFSQKEKDKYKDYKFIAEKFTYPIVIPSIEVDAGRQWVGSISAKKILELEDAGKIRYNIEKQRVRKQIVRGEDIAYKLDVKERSVREIAELMKKGEYIPDIITLDLPEDDDTLDYEYVEGKRELVIRKIDHFDISDGFHRLLAMKRCKMEKPGFDYPMEIRITLFPIYRTQSFVYQQDQKNKMSVTNSNSMNKNRASNIVVDRLNETGNGCNLSGQIKRSGGILEYSALSDLIEYYWFNSTKRTFTNKDIAEVMNEVKTLLNTFVDTNPDYYEQYINYKILAVYFWMIKEKGISPQQAAKKVIKAKKIGTLDNIKLRKVRKTLFNQIESLGIC